MPLGPARASAGPTPTGTNSRGCADTGNTPPPLDATAMHAAINLGAQVIGVFNEAAPVPAKNYEL